jgi:hypothetical protein
MSRTTNGNLTGKAARTQYADLTQQIEDGKKKFAADWKATLNKLEDLLGDGFDAWWDSYPADIAKRDFLPIMKAEIKQRELCAAFVGENAPDMMRIRYAVAGAFILPMTVKEQADTIAVKYEAAHAIPHTYQDYTAEIDASEADFADLRQTEHDAAM